MSLPIISHNGSKSGIFDISWKYSIQSDTLPNCFQILFPLIYCEYICDSWHWGCIKFELFHARASATLVLISLWLWCLIIIIRNYNRVTVIKQSRLGKGCLSAAMLYVLAAYRIAPLGAGNVHIYGTGIVRVSNVDMYSICSWVWCQSMREDVWYKSTCTNSSSTTSITLPFKFVSVHPMTLNSHHGPVTIKRPSSPGMGIPMLKIRRCRNRLMFNMGIPILARRHLYIATATGRPYT